jgi:hypothetical protein
MVNQYPAMLMTYLEEGVAPMGCFQWPVPAMLGVVNIAGFHSAVPPPFLNTVYVSALITFFPPVQLTSWIIRKDRNTDSMFF